MKSIEVLLSWFIGTQQCCSSTQAHLSMARTVCCCPCWMFVCNGKTLMQREDPWHSIV